jgi:hypothetical protein
VFGDQILKAFEKPDGFYLVISGKCDIVFQRKREVKKKGVRGAGSNIDFIETIDPNQTIKEGCTTEDSEPETRGKQ